MPKMPSYDSKRSLATQQPQFLRTGRDDSQLLDIAAKGIGAVTETVIKWSNAVDTIQTTTAKANFSTGALDILNRAANDVDYNNSDAYYKEIENLRKNSLKGFTNKAVGDMVALDIGHDAEVARLKIENIYKKKTIEIGQVNALRLIDLEKSNYINAPDDKGKIISAATIKSIIDAQVGAGIFGLKEGDKLYKDSIKEAQQVIQDQEGLRKKQEKEILLANQIAQNEREDTLVQMRLNMADEEGNPLNPVDLVNMARTEANEGQISPRFAQVYINSLKSVKVAKPTKLENIKKYNELVFKNKALHDKEWAWREASFEDRANFRADVLEANADGQITDKQRDTFLEKNTKKFYADPKVRNAIAAVIARADLYPTPEAKATVKAEMHFDLINKIIEGKNPDDALAEVVYERIRTDYPGYKVEDLEFTARETGLTIQQVYELLQKKAKK